MKTVDIAKSSYMCLKEPVVINMVQVAKCELRLAVIAGEFYQILFVCLFRVAAKCWFFKVKWTDK